MSDAGSILYLKQVRKGFCGGKDSTEVLKGVDLSLSSGDFAVITGPSGSGKTTLLMVAGLLYAADGGDIRFEGKDIFNATERFRCEVRKCSIGMVFQKFCLLPHRTVLENVLFRFRYLPHGAASSPRDAAEKALSRVGLLDKAKQAARLLSAGEMQRVAIARAVVHPPRLLLADEPTGNLDPDSAGRVMELFAEFQRDGMAVLVVTHNPDWLRKGVRHAVMKEGRLEWQSSDLEKAS